MDSRVKVEVFGMADVGPSKSGGCGCHNGCYSTQPMGVLYEHLIEYLREYKIIDKVDISFIDVLHEKLDGHKDISSMLDQGFSLPYVKVNGRMRFYGDIPNKDIYLEIKRHV